MTAFERWSVWTTALLVTASGLVYLWMKYVLVPADPYAVINHPLQPLVLKLHILTAPLLVFSLGLVTTRHVWRHYASGMREGRRSGLSAALSVIPMVLTGYLIQAVTAERWLVVVAWAHIIAGLVFALGLLAHRVAVRRRLAGPVSRRFPA